MTLRRGAGDALVELLRRPRYEVFPIEGIEDEVAEHVPQELKITVTSSSARGIDRTLDVAEALADRGFEVVPHLSARLFVDDEHLKSVLDRLHGIGVHEVLAIGGDVKQPGGRFGGAFELLTAMAALGSGPEAVGIAGYPESHPFISDEDTIGAMIKKAPLANYIVSQLCFEPAVIEGWIAAVRARGVDLPIYVGVPGVVGRRRLLRIATRIGVGESARFLRKHGALLARLFFRGSYSPSSIVEGLRPHLGDPRDGIGGFHFYTFNEVGKTERWRQETIRRLDVETGP